MNHHHHRLKKKNHMQSEYREQARQFIDNYEPISNRSTGNYDEDCANRRNTDLATPSMICHIWKGNYLSADWWMVLWWSFAWNQVTVCHSNAAQKENGSTKMCLDYRRVIKQMIQGRFLLLQIAAHLLDALQGTQVFKCFWLKEWLFPVHGIYMNFEDAVPFKKILSTNPFKQLAGVSMKQPENLQLNQLINGKNWEKMQKNWSQKFKL